MNPKKIVEKGSIKLKVKSEGMLQAHEFKIEVEKTAFGNVPFLVAPHDLSETELLRVAKETNLPVRLGSMRVFPPGKMPKDFVELLK